MRTVTVSHNWYSFLQCSGIAVPTVFGVPSDISCWDQGKGVSGVVGISQNESRAGTFPDITPSLRHFTSKCTVVGAGGKMASQQLKGGGGGSR